MTSLLEVNNLSVDFRSSAGTVNAVSDVSFRVARGEILGIVGESGSGKSVSCRAALGLLPGHARLSGKIIYDDKDMSELSAAEFQQVRGRQISMIFQNPSSHLDPLMTIGDHVAEPLRHHFGLDARTAKQEALKLLEEVRIQDAARRFDAYPHQLSGGMKQRVLIAAALACKPALLLADEPTTALDVTVQASILELLRNLNRQRGLSMVFVSHDLGVIAEICDRVVVMHNGEVVEQGSVAEIVGNPQHDYTRLLIGSQPGRLDNMVSSKDCAESLLEIENLSVHFASGGGIRAVDDVTLDVRAGESFGVVGESGSGKSTIARTLVRLINATGGSIRYNGQVISELRGVALEQYRRQVQMIFQNPYDSLNPRSTVIQTIAEPIWRHRLASRNDARAKAGELMEMVELPPELANRRPRQLSGGQCQRVAIARALALSPRLLIADEVTSALDVTIQAQILKLLARLQKHHNLTIVYISHDLSVVRKFCDRVAVFHHGKLVEAGPTNEVFDNPGEEYTRMLVAAAPDIDATLGATYKV